MTNPPKYKNKPDAEHRFWLYSPEGDGFMFFPTAAQRDEFAKYEVSTYADDGHWMEEVEDLIAGTVTHTIHETVKATKPEDYDRMTEDEQDDEWPYGDEAEKIVDYTLEPLP